jgi:hypothetical protein
MMNKEIKLCHNAFEIRKYFKLNVMKVRAGGNGLIPLIFKIISAYNRRSMLTIIACPKSETCFKKVAVSKSFVNNSSRKRQWK